MNASTAALQDKDLERLARKRAGAKMGWYIHATVFVIVNLMLAGFAAASGHSWTAFPAFGWGIGLAIHGVVVFLGAGGAGLHQHLLRQERQRLAAQRDPW